MTSMPNLVTDRLKLVNVEPFRGIPLINNLISTSLTPSANINQEVFRGNIHLGTVYPLADQHIHQAESEIKVYNGDIIYRVTMLPQPDTIVGTLSTKDKYKRIYELPIQLIVSNSHKFVEEYQIANGPADVAIRTFKSWFEKHAQNFNHDQIIGLQLPTDNWNETLSLYYGIRIVQDAKPTFREDPARTELLATRFELQNRLASLEKEAKLREFEFEMKCIEESQQNEYQREELAKKNTFDRQEETKKHIYSLRKKFRDAAANELISILKECIREGYERDKPMEEISSEYISLMDADGGCGR